MLPDLAYHTRIGTLLSLNHQACPRALKAFVQALPAVNLAFINLIEQLQADAR